MIIAVVGESYVFGCKCMKNSFLTLQNIASLSFIDSGIGISLLHTKISGFIPKDCNSFTECWVGFDFISFDIIKSLAVEFNQMCLNKLNK